LYRKKIKDFSLEKCFIFLLIRPVCWICVGGGAGGRRAGGSETGGSSLTLIYKILNSKKNFIFVS